MTQLTQYTQSLQFDISSATDAGPTGKENEDSYEQFEVPVQNTMGELSKILIGVVADGIGGEAGGSEASQIAVGTIKASLLSDGATPIGERLGKAVRQANHTIYTRSESSALYNGMGTTIVAAAIDGNTLHVVHAGDSRAYLIRNQRAIRLTQDHSWVQEAIDAGRYTLAEAKAHPNRNVIKRYLGIEERIEVDHELRNPDSVFANIQSGVSVEARVPMVLQVQLQPNDVVLLCTDGLNDVVNDEQIERLVEPLSLHKSAEKLVNAALKQGTTDNTTVQLIGPKQPAMAVGASAASSLTGSSATGSRMRLIAGAGITFLFVALAAAIYFLLLNPSLNVPIDDIAVEDQSTLAVATSSDAISNSNEPTPTAGSDSLSQVASNDNQTDDGIQVEQEPTVALVATEAVKTATAVQSTATNMDEPKPAMPEPEATAVQNSDLDISSSALVSNTADTAAVQPLELDKGETNNGENAAGATSLVNGAAATSDATATLTPLPTSTPIPTATPLPPIATNTATPLSTATLLPTPTAPPTSTPVPEATLVPPTPTALPPTPTSVPPTSVPPTAPPIQPTPTFTPVPAQQPGPTSVQSASLPPSLPADLPSSVTLLSPDDGITVRGRVRFSWSSDGTLSSGYEYELVFWREGEDAMANGKGFADTTEITEDSVNWDNVNAPNDNYLWGVLLVKKSPSYERIKYLGGQRIVNFKESSSSDNSGNGSGSSETTGDSNLGGGGRGGDD